MKICNLQLLAFGPFTNKSLDFSDGNFHIVFGPNEAGKSSALRAVADFLYGIPARSSDDFIHNYSSMRLGATLENSAGLRATFLRRKGNRNTLLNEKGEPLPDSEIAPFLGNIKRELFLQMFGLSHQRLIEGGRDILSGKGDVGESIFSAGMGVIGLRKVLEELESQAEKLFKPSGQIPDINRLINDIKNAKTALSAASLSAGAYKEKANELEKVLAQRTSLQKQSAQLTNRLERLERLKNAAPKVAQLAQAESDRSELGSVVLLSDDFPERRRNLWEKRRAAEADITSLQSDIDQLKQKIAENTIEAPIVELKTSISELFKDQGVFIKDQKDLPGLEEAHRGLLQSVKTLLGKLGLRQEIDEAENLYRRLTSPEQTRIKRAADQLKDLRWEISSATKEERKLAGKIADAKAELTEMPKSREKDPLHRAVKTATSVSPKIDERENLESEIRNLRNEIERRLERLSPPAASEAEEIVKLQIPSEKTIERFEKESNDLQTRLQQIDKEIGQTETEREKRAAQIRTIQKGETIPSEEQLVADRARRDRGWKLVRLSWEGPAPEPTEIIEFAGDQPLAAAYEKIVKKADHTADTLRRESSRVAELHQLTATKSQLEEKLKKLENEKKAIVVKQQEWETEWENTWTPARISPLPPAEMIPWHRELQDLIKDFRDRNEKEYRLEKLTITIEETRDRLIAECKKNDCPSDATLPFSELLSHAEETLEKINWENQARKQKEDELTKLTRELRQTERDLADFTAREETARNKWGETVAPLGLSSTSSPEEAQTVLDDIGEVFQKLKDAHSHRERIEQIKDRCERFENRLASLLENLGETSDKRPPEDIVEHLSQRRIKSQKNQELNESFQQEILKKEEKRQEAEARKETVAGQIEDLLKEAKTDDEENLPDLERTSKKAQELDQSITSVRRELIAFCRNESPEELIAAIHETDIDSLPGEISQVQADQEELQQQLNALAEEVGGLRTQLNELDGSPAAAQKAQEIEELKAKLKVKIEDFARARLASTLLRREIERYREKHQGPVLQRTGEIFSRLTLGSFSGLETDFTGTDQQILVGLRPDDTKVPVEGMSDGTCDQLYLALRLASLEHHIENSEPMPLILDDILVNFDDERARATLELLSEISGKNQIIYFTHHRHILEIAKPLQTTIHELSPISTNSLSENEPLATLS